MTSYAWNTTNGEWKTAADWTGPLGVHAVPTQLDTATIADGATVSVASTDTDATAATLNVTSGAVDVTGKLEVHTDATGTVTLTGGTYQFDGTGSGAGSGNIVDFTSAGGSFVDSTAWSGSIQDFYASTNDALTFGSSITGFNYNTGTDTLAVSTLLSGVYSLKFIDPGNLLTQDSFSVGLLSNQVAFNGVTTVCFASGTRIRTARGDVAVEALQVGDFALTASGESRPIRWIGHRSLDCRRHPRPHEVLPVRVAAGAFGANKPARDLVVSPGHAICVDVVGEALIPAYALVNGATIQQLDVDEVTYWHVELDSHDVLLAENLAAESYYDAGNRAFFSESDIVRLDLTPEAADRVHANFRHPFHEAGALVEVVRAQLLLRARGLGWTLHHDPFADLRLVADGRRIDPILEGRRARFVVPEGAQEVWLASATTRPLDVGAGADPRTLGVCLSGLSVEAAESARAIALDDPALGAGFHNVERDGERMWRWTTGDARLPATLFGGAPCVLAVDLGGDAPPRWAAPAPAAEVALVA